ncbi:hypothetical protein DFP72DRAFT_914484 [Ephemerocybe angulata]|uniref:BTB domain-containing protein n=1 Tax=Ephemerocybe angulata TaxID=980116 RepID=A0A8H6M0W0_9AGAR|nr:hypothetical protein DFP72DRAFT_914484 [Tulosesus angulatus]
MAETQVDASDLSVEHSSALSSQFCISWDTVVFKVEDGLFRVPRHGFVEASEVFATMFSLPTRAGSRPEDEIEGQSADNPIVLEGYLKVDFLALLKVLYPTYDEVMAGRFNMTKSEWISALKLSTVWGIRKIRQWAIKELSSPAFIHTPLEKIEYARAYHISNWLVEGISAIVKNDGQDALSPSDLSKAVGIETAYQIMTLRARGPSILELKLSVHEEGPYLTCNIGSIHCPNCSSIFFPEFSCNTCGSNMSISDGSNNVYFLKGPKLRGNSKGGVKAWVRLDVWGISCVKCDNHPPAPADPECEYCGEAPSGGYAVLDIGEGHVSLTEEAVREEFKEEIAAYALADV